MKLSVCMEMLKAQFLLRAKRKDYVVPEKIFDKALSKNGLRDRLRQSLRETLSASRPPQTTLDEEVLSNEALAQAIETMVGGGKPKELNRRAFGDVLGEMCGEVGLLLPEEERSRFVKIRNILVHQGDFPASQGDASEQSRFLNDFVGRFILATLGFLHAQQPGHSEPAAAAADAVEGRE